MDWVEYWSHGSTHFKFWEKIIEIYFQNLTKEIDFSLEDIVLDYGAGPGFLTKHLAPLVKECYLVEPSDSLVQKAKELNASYANVHYLASVDKNDLMSLFDRTKFNTIVINSVMQYIPKEKVSDLFDVFKKGLKEGGEIIVTDLIPNKSIMFFDLWDVFLFFLKQFNILEFIRYLYWEMKKSSLRSQLILSTYHKKEFEALFNHAFDVRWIENLTICTKRISCILSLK